MRRKTDILRAMKRLRDLLSFSLILLPWSVIGVWTLAPYVWDSFVEDLMQKTSAILSWPASFLQSCSASISWARLLTVRRGFLLGALAGFSIVGSMLWAIPEVASYMPHSFVEPIIPPSSFMPIARGSVPSELAWFFIQFPYVSESAQVRSKNHHTFIVTDSSRRRNYVVQFRPAVPARGEFIRRTPRELQVQIFTPGSKRIVMFQGPRVVTQSTVPDGNLWMWKGPLWNAQHFKIYGQADMWLDSPYKRYSCAGFVHRFLKDANIEVPELDAWDMAKLPWVRVPMEELEPGDIITIKALTAQHRRFWGHRVTHVGVYIGNGKIIHAATSSVHATRSWVRVADLDEFRGRIDKILRAPELL